MFNSYIFIFSLLLSLSLISLEPQIMRKTGNEWVKDVQEYDAKGRYTPFLKRLNKRYLKGNAHGEWNELITQRERSKKLSLAEQRKQHEVQQQIANFKKSLDVLIEKTNLELEKIILESPDELISKIVREYIDYQEDPWVSQLANDTEFSKKCENCFEEIAKEGEIKRYILYSLLDEISTERYEEYGVIIGLQEYQKMFKEANLDTELKNYLTKSQEQYLKLAAKNHNYTYLVALTMGRVPLNSSTEQDVAHVMHNFLDDKKELMKKYRLLE